MELFNSLFRGVVGIAGIIGIALLVSKNRRQTDWRMVGAGLSLQIALAVLILKGEAMAGLFAPLGWPKVVFSQISSFFVLLLGFTGEGSQFLFGDLARPPASDILPGTPLVTGSAWGSLIAFQVLPTIIFFGAVMAIGYHLGILQFVVRAMSRAMSRIMGTSGAESLSVTANIFVGQTEAPLVIRPYLERMTKSELLAVMTGGMATIAGGVMAAYIVFLGVPFAAAQGLEIHVAQLRFAEHLLGASLMSAPAALIIAKIIYPETGTPATLGVTTAPMDKTTRNVIDAAATGAGDGLKLALNVGAMLIAFIALIAMCDYLLGWTSGLIGRDLTFTGIMGWVFAPLAWLIGVPASDITEFGALLGTKIVANEFVAYLQLAQNISQSSLSPKTVTMATFALCGFANLSSIAIQIGGIAPLAPSRRSDLAELGLWAVFAGLLANVMTATIAGMLTA